MLTVLEHHGWHTLLHEVVMIGTEEPAVGVIIVEVDISALSSSCSGVILVQRALSTTQYHHIVC